MTHGSSSHRWLLVTLPYPPREDSRVYNWSPRWARSPTGLTWGFGEIHGAASKWHHCLSATDCIGDRSHNSTQNLGRGWLQHCVNTRWVRWVLLPSKNKRRFTISSASFSVFEPVYSRGYWVWFMAHLSGQLHIRQRGFLEPAKVATCLPS